MDVIIHEDHLGYTIGISGDLDASSAILLDNALEQALAASAKDVFVDCTRLDYISSPGIGVFTSRIEDCEAEGRKIWLFGVSEKVLNVFSILGLDRLLPIYRSKEELIHAMKNNGAQH